MKRAKKGRIIFSVIVAIVVLGLLFLQGKLGWNFSDPNTTFEKEVTQKIEDEEVSYIQLIAPLDRNAISVDDPSEIESILAELSTLQLKRLNSFPDGIDFSDNLSINIAIQKDTGYYIWIYNDSNYLSILDLKKNSMVKYEMKNDLDLDDLKTIFYTNTTK